jgi:hypothetical protein
MSKTRIRAALGCCLLAAAILTWAQALSKPGPWEVTNTMTWVKTPMPGSMALPKGVPNPLAPTTVTTEMCLTQEMVDEHGAPIPQSPIGECQRSNVVIKPTGMTADLTCTGASAGKGTLESSWTTPDRSVGKLHFIGIMQIGSKSLPVEYTVETTSTYKGPDCGSAVPLWVGNCNSDAGVSSWKGDVFFGLYEKSADKFTRTGFGEINGSMYFNSGNFACAKGILKLQLEPPNGPWLQVTEWKIVNGKLEVKVGTSGKYALTALDLQGEVEIEKLPN